MTWIFIAIPGWGFHHGFVSVIKTERGIEDTMELTPDYPDFHFEYKGARCKIYLGDRRTVMREKIMYDLWNISLIELNGIDVHVSVSGFSLSNEYTVMVYDGYCKNHVSYIAPLRRRNRKFFALFDDWDETPAEHLERSVRLVKDAIDETIQKHSCHREYFDRLVRSCSL